MLGLPPGGSQPYPTGVERFLDLTVTQQLGTLNTTQVGTLPTVVYAGVEGRSIILPAANGLSTSSFAKRTFPFQIAPNSFPIHFYNKGTPDTDAVYLGVALPGFAGRFDALDISTAAGVWSVVGNHLFRRRPRAAANLSTFDAAAKAFLNTLDSGAATVGTNTNSTHTVYKLAPMTSTLCGLAFADSSDDIKVACGKLQADRSWNWSSITTIRSNANVLQYPQCVAVAADAMAVFWYDSTAPGFEWCIVKWNDLSTPTHNSTGTVTPDPTGAGTKWTSATGDKIAFCRSGGDGSANTSFVARGALSNKNSLYHFTTSGTTITLTSTLEILDDFNTAPLAVFSNTADEYWTIGWDNAVSGYYWIAKVTNSGGTIAVTWRTSVPALGGGTTDLSLHLVYLDSARGVAGVLTHGSMLYRVYFNPSTGAHWGQEQVDVTAPNVIGLGILPQNGLFTNFGNGDWGLFTSGNFALGSMKGLIDGTPRSGTTNYDSTWTPRTSNSNTRGWTPHGCGIHVPTRRLFQAARLVTAAGGNMRFAVAVYDLPAEFTNGVYDHSVYGA